MITADQEPLLRAIADEPDCDEPRIDFANWCQEAGGEEGRLQAKLIKLQIALHKLAPAQPGADRLAAECAPLLTSCGRNWEGPLRDRGWTVTGFSRGLPSGVISQRIGDIRPDARLAGVERMELQSHMRLTSVVTELSQSEWSNGVRELVLPEGTDHLAVVSLALATHFSNLTRLRLPEHLHDTLGVALLKSRNTSAARFRQPSLPRLASVNDTPLQSLLTRAGKGQVV